MGELLQDNTNCLKVMMWLISTFILMWMVIITMIVHDNAEKNDATMMGTIMTMKEIIKMVNNNRNNLDVTKCNNNTKINDAANDYANGDDDAW